jgi:hypothetical protein
MGHINGAMAGMAKISVYGALKMSEMPALSPDWLYLVQMEEPSLKEQRRTWLGWLSDPRRKSTKTTIRKQIPQTAIHHH